MMTALMLLGIAAFAASPVICVAAGAVSGMRERRRVERISRSLDAALASSEMMVR